MQDKKLIALIIVFMAPLSGMGIDIYSPALPMMRAQLDISVLLGGLTMTLYLIGYALGLAIVGPLSDSIGRVKVLTVGLYLFIVVSICMLFADSISLFLVLRFLQGVAVASPGVIFKVLITDHFDEHTLPKISTNAGIAWALGPVVAPFIGGFLAHHLGWRACFGFLAMYAILILLLRYRVLNEFNPHPSKLTIRTVLSNYAHVLQSKVFIGFILVLSLGYSVFILFNVNGPFLIQAHLGFSAPVYGSCALILGSGYLIGVTLNRFLIHKFSLISVTRVGLLLFGLSSFLLALTGFLGWVHLDIIVIFTMLSYFSIGLIFSNVLSRCMLLFKEKAGTANAVMNAAFVSGAAVISVIGSHLPFSSQAPLGIAYLVMFIMMALVLLIVEKRLSQKPVAITSKN